MQIMTYRDRLRRLATIKVLAESSRYEQGSDARPPTPLERAAGDLAGQRAGAEWVAYHRGQIGWDRYPLQGRRR